jgi:ABC-type transport system substrate-binding protein
MIGTRLASRYEIVAEIGRGGMGVVYRARDPVLNREVAVKLVPPQLLTPQAEERFQREARVVAQMDHPSIVPIFDFGNHEGSVFFLMPVVTGQNLRQFLREKARTLGDIINIAIHTADALEYSHARDVIHRDIKPENIMVSEEESSLRVRVMDFGLARATSEDRITRTGTLLGTVAYFSPEQVSAGRTDGRSDIYALGTVLYECIAGQPPFSGETQTILYRIVHEFPSPLRTLGAEISDELEAIVMKALHKDPARRYQRGSEMAEALRSYHAKLQESERAKSIVLTNAVTAQFQRPGAAPFIGRQSELAELQRRLNLAADGECQFVTVAGEPGIGKTRLIEELTTLAKARRIRVLHGRFVEQDRTFSYQGFCEVIQDYFRSRESASATSSSAGEPRDFSDLAPELVSLFPVLSEIPEIRTAAGGDAALSSVSARPEDRTSVYELLARTLIRIAGGQPLVLVLENLHGAEMSLDALQYVVRRLGPTPTLILGTYRQTEIDKAHPLVKMLDGFNDDPRFASIYLGSLTPSEHRELLEATVGSSSLSPELAERLYEATEANPFFTKELVRSLVESGGIAPDDTGEWSLSGEFGGISTDALPATIQQAVEKRIERLPEELRSVLATASVLGKTFDFRDLEILSKDEGDLDDLIERLISEGIIEEERESRGDRLTFTSGIVRDVLYSGLSRRKRKLLHRSYGEQLEKRFHDRLDRVYPQLVHHFSEGDVPEKTVGYGFELARKSLNAFSPEEAIHVIRKVLEFLEDEEWGPDRSREGEARLILASAARLQGSLETALREVEAAIRVFEKEERSDHLVEAILLASEVAWQARKVEETRQWLMQGIEVSRSSGHADVLRRLLSLAATVANLRGEYEKAREYLEEIQSLSSDDREGTESEVIPAGGELTVALANPPRAREPAAVGLDEEVEILALVFETLVATDERGHVIPSLCQTWDVREDGRSMTLHLRDDVRFHDGSLLTAKDVKASFERSVLIRKREMSAAFTVIEGVEALRKKEATELSGVVVHSDHVLEIRISEALPIYPAFLTDPTTGIVKIIEGDDGTEIAVGTGPFRLSSHDERTMRLERNDTYYEPERPPLDAIDFRTMEAASAISEGLRSGRIDIARDLTPQDLEQVLRDPRFRAGLVETPKRNTYFVVFNQSSIFGGNQKLRRALCGMIRTHDLVWRSLGRLAQPAAGLIPPGILGHDPGRKREFLGAQQAIEILDEAGIERPLTLRASIHPLFQDRYRSLTSAMTDLWTELGVSLEIGTPTMEAFLDSFQDDGEFDLIIARWNADYDDPDNFTHGLFKSGNGVFSAYFSNEEMDRQLEAARGESNPSSREILYRRFENAVLESGAILPLFHEIDYRIATPRVRGMQLRSSPPYVNYTEIGKASQDSGKYARPARATGGFLHVPIAEDISSIDPIMAATVERCEVIPAIFDTLTRVDGASIIPWLASDYRPENEGKRIRFFLRNVLFHNGRRLTARDVRYSWERLLQSAQSRARWILTPILGAQRIIDGNARDLEGFRILSNTEFTVDLERPLSFFGTIIAQPPAAILQEGTENLSGSWRENCVGTGPFRVVRFEPGRRLEVERNPDYWRPGLPKSEGILFRLGLTPKEVLSEFKAGHLSLASELFPEDVESLRHDPELAAGYRETPRLSIYFAGFNHHEGPLRDPELRREIVARLDVAGIVRRTLGRLAIPAHGVIPPGLLGYSAEGGMGRVAPTKGRIPEEIELMAIVHPMFAGQYNALAKQLEGELNKVGVKIKVLNQSMAEYSDLIAHGKGDLVVGRWIADYPDTDTFTQGLFHSQGGFLGAYCSTPEIDKLCEQGRLELDPAIRHSLYRRVEELVARDHLLLPLFHEQVYSFARPEVEGLSLNFSTPTVSYETLRISR